jgi:hypothetical protein
MLLLFASLPVTLLLPAGYARAVVAAPVALMAPGSVTLGAIFRPPRRPDGAAFVCWAALLSVSWSVFASLALAAAHVKITAASTYLCLLAVMAALTIAAVARMLRPGAVRDPDAANPGRSHDAADQPDRASAGRGRYQRGSYQAIAAAVAGLALLAGGAYARDHLSHPAPVGYTWLAWAGPQVKGILPVGAHGTTLPFRVIHQEHGTATFQLSADWQGSPPRPLASPLTFTVGPNRTYHGDLFVPPLPTGCTYRLVVTLAGPREAGQAAHKQTWSINADVHQPGKSQKTCR